MLEREHIELLAREAAREVAAEIMQQADARIAAAVSKGMQEHYNSIGLKIHHLIWVKDTYDAQRSNWSIVRRTVVGALVAFALYTGVRGLWVYTMEKVITTDRGGRGGDIHASLRQEPTE